MKDFLSIKTLLLISVIGLTLALYWDVFATLITIWNTREEYGHGFIIPLISAYFIGQKKYLILANKWQPSWFGVGVIVFAMSSYFVGTVGDIDFLFNFSFIFLLLGLSLTIAGYNVSKIILIPILILIFAFPLPSILQATLTAKMQLISSQLGVAFIRFCNITAYLEGNIIDLGNYQLNIVEACSGLNYLFPLMSLAFICTYFYQVVFWKRLIVFLSAIPITIFMNSFRISMIAILKEYSGLPIAEDFLHYFEGWFVFMSCLIILISEMWVLCWQERKIHTWEKIFGMVYPPIPAYPRPYPLSLVRIYASILLMIAVLVLVKPLAMREDVIPTRQSLNTFPLQLASLMGTTTALAQETIEFLGLTDYTMVNYQDNQHQLVNFYVAYYQTQKNGTVPHSPKQCIPSDGWQIIDLTETTFKGLTFNRVLIKKGDRQQLVYYWYQQRGRSIANEYVLKWHTFIGSLKLRRTDGALIRLTTTLNSNQAIEVADMRLQNFMQLIKPKLATYIPN
jgi:exosortase D (VPLPA-CTERM-specific)